MSDIRGDIKASKNSEFKVNDWFVRQTINLNSSTKTPITIITVDDTDIEARQKNVETAVQKIPEITEKFGELKKRCDPADV